MHSADGEDAARRVPRVPRGPGVPEVAPARTRVRRNPSPVRRPLRGVDVPVAAGGGPVMRNLFCEIADGYVAFIERSKTFTAAETHFPVVKNQETWGWWQGDGKTDI